jgi:hypothetical protein
MSQIEQKIKTEVAWETSEISKSEFYLPPVHKRIPHPYIENVDFRNLSPKTGNRTLGLNEHEDFERQKQLLIKKYSFPSSNPISKTPREMQETYSFMAKQLILSKETSMHTKQRAKKKPEHGNVDVNQVVKDAETLLHTAKIVLRASRRQAQEAVIIHPTGAFSNTQRAISPSYLSSIPKAPFDSQSSIQLNNSPIAPTLNPEQKLAKAKVSPEKHVMIARVEPMIRIFKAELVPVSNSRTKIQDVEPDAALNKSMREIENSSKMKGLMMSEKV